MPRWVFSLGVGMALVAVAFVVTDTCIGPRPGMTEANARRIRPGMTLKDVQLILPEWPSLESGSPDGVVLLWRDGDNRVYVSFGFDSSVRAVKVEWKINPDLLGPIR